MLTLVCFVNWNRKIGTLEIIWGCGAREAFIGLGRRQEAQFRVVGNTCVMYNRKRYSRSAFQK